MADGGSPTQGFEKVMDAVIYFFSSFTMSIMSREERFISRKKKTCTIAYCSGHLHSVYFISIRLFIRCSEVFSL